MLTKTDLKLLIAGCEAYLAGDYDHQYGFCYWFQHWLQRQGEDQPGGSRGYGIVENFGVEHWLAPGYIYVDLVGGRTTTREAFVLDLHAAAIARLEGQE